MSYHNQFPEQPPSYMEATGGGPGGGGGGGFNPSAPPPPPPNQSQPQPPSYLPPAHDIEDLRVWFFAVDEDGNGHITADELRQALLDEKCRPFSLATCKMLVRMFDDNSNGEIELDEFVQLYHYVRKWREIFLRHDADSSGTIELGELIDSLNALHTPLRFSRQFCTQVLRRFGHRQSGEHCLALDSFIAINAKISRLVKEFSGQPGAIENFLLTRLRDS